MRVAETRRLRRAAGVVLTALLLVLAVLFVVRTPGSAVSPQSAGRPSGAGSGSGASSDGTGPTGTASTATGTTGATSGSTPTAATGSPPSDGGLTVGPGRSAPGVQFVAQPRSDGSWDVIEYVRPASATAVLKLSRPRIAQVPAFEAQEAQISQLQATADDQLAVVSGRPGAGWQVDSSNPAQQYVLRYVLSGNTIRSVPSKAGRALSVLGPVADPGSSAAVEIVAAGSTVRGLQCPLLSEDAQLCQAGAPPSLRTATFLPRRTALALVQFDLPAPS